MLSKHLLKECTSLGGLGDWSVGGQPGMGKLGLLPGWQVPSPAGGMPGGLSSVPAPQAASEARQRHLSSLQDYMQRCTNELYWLDQQVHDRMQYDWSDRNLDYPSRRRQYEVGAGARERAGKGHRAASQC